MSAWYDAASVRNGRPSDDPVPVPAKMNDRMDDGHGRADEGDTLSSAARSGSHSGTGHGLGADPAERRAQGGPRRRRAPAEQQQDLHQNDANQPAADALDTAADGQARLALPNRRAGSIVRWLFAVGDSVSWDDTLCHYTVTEGHGAATPQVIKELKTRVKGKISEILVPAGGHARTGEPVVVIEQGCRHPMIIADALCAVCGADVQQERAKSEMSNLNNDKRRDPQLFSMIHNMPGLQVDEKAAKAIASREKESLLQSKKLVLIVDLDQTLIHAVVSSQVPWIGQFLRDNVELQKEIFNFSLPNHPHLYYIKLRPGAREFLAQATKLFELHIFTMGSRMYASRVAAVLDPDGALFGSRIMSRDESKSANFKHTQLSQLFPSGHNMVAVLDDRIDVWARLGNVIQISPYEYFLGANDINALPMDLAKGGRSTAAAQDVDGLESPAGVDAPASPSSSTATSTSTSTAAATAAATNNTDATEPPAEDAAALRTLAEAESVQVDLENKLAANLHIPVSLAARIPQPVTVEDPAMLVPEPNDDVQFRPALFADGSIPMQVVTETIAGFLSSEESLEPPTDDAGAPIADAVMTEAPSGETSTSASLAATPEQATPSEDTPAAAPAAVPLPRDALRLGITYPARTDNDCALYNALTFLVLVHIEFFKRMRRAQQQQQQQQQHGAVQEPDVARVIPDLLRAFVPSRALMNNERLPFNELVELSEVHDLLQRASVSLAPELLPLPRPTLRSVETLALPADEEAGPPMRRDATMPAEMADIKPLDSSDMSALFDLDDDDGDGDGDGDEELPQPSQDEESGSAVRRAKRKAENDEERRRSKEPRLDGDADKDSDAEDDDDDDNDSDSGSDVSETAMPSKETDTGDEDDEDDADNSEDDNDDDEDDFAASLEASIGL